MITVNAGDSADGFGTWEEDAAESRRRRDIRIAEYTAILRALHGSTYDVTEHTPFHFSVNGRLDIWPSHGRYYDLAIGIRGHVRAGDLESFLADHFARFPVGLARAVRCARGMAAAAGAFRYVVERGSEFVIASALPTDGVAWRVHPGPIALDRIEITNRKERVQRIARPRRK